ncbi:MAG: hypothetical protein GY805_19560 [Chloroflexi bacterium]|nr:hypothetical protein [Chloroflexota bacterium]
MPDDHDLSEQLKQAAEWLSPDDLQNMIAMLTLMPQFAFGAGPVIAAQQPANPFTSNRTFWETYHGQRLRDTQRVRLEHFHLFEWFPLSPGRYHTEDGRYFRQDAKSQLTRGTDGLFYNPYGKVNMIKGGVGAVKLKTRLLANTQGQAEPFAFMTASSTGTCHDGIPVLVPRRLYAELTDRLIDEGGIPITLTGELRFLPDDAYSFFDQLRFSYVPKLVIHADSIEVLPHPRSNVTKYTIAIALTFLGEFRQQSGVFATYASFDPATRSSRESTVSWLEQYVRNYAGQVITDFDEQFPRFADAPFALKRIMDGQMDADLIHTSLREVGYYYAFPDEEGLTQQIINQHNHFVNIVGPRGVLVNGNVGGSIITGDGNQL